MDEAKLRRLFVTGPLEKGRAHPPMRLPNLAAGTVLLPETVPEMSGVRYRSLGSKACKAAWGTESADGSAAEWASSKEVRVLTWANSLHAKHVAHANQKAEQLSTVVNFDSAAFLHLGVDNGAALDFPGVYADALRVQWKRSSTGTRPTHVRVLGLAHPNLDLDSTTFPPVAKRNVYARHTVSSDLKVVPVTDQPKFRSTNLGAGDYVYCRARQQVFQSTDPGRALDVATLPAGTLLWDAFLRWDLLTHPSEEAGFVDKSLPANTVAEIKWVDPSKASELLTHGALVPAVAADALAVGEVLLENTGATRACSAFLVDFGVLQDGAAARDRGVPAVEVVEAPRRLPGKRTNAAGEVVEREFVTRVLQLDDRTHPDHGTVVWWDANRAEERYRVVQGAVQKVEVRELRWSVGDWIDPKDKPLGKKFTITQPQQPALLAEPLVDGAREAFTRLGARKADQVFVCDDSSGGPLKYFHANADLAGVWHEKGVAASEAEVLAAARPLLLTLHPGWSFLYKSATADADYLARLDKTELEKLRDSTYDDKFVEDAYAPRPGETREQFVARLKAVNNDNPLPPLATATAEQKQQWLEKARGLSAGASSRNKAALKDALAKNQVGTHLYKVVDAAGTSEYRTNCTGLAYDERGEPVRVRVPGTFKDVDRAQRTAALGNSSDPSRNFAECMQQPDRVAAQTAEYDATLADARRITDNKCKWATEYDTYREKVSDIEVGWLGSHDKSTDKEVPYLKGHRQEGCEAVNALTSRNTVNRSASICNVAVDRSAVGLSQTLSLNLEIGNVTTKGPCCNISIIQEGEQVLNFTQNIKNTTTPSITDSVIVGQATSMDSGNFKSQKWELPAEGNKNVESQNLSLPQPGGKNVQTAFNGVTNDQRFLQYVEHSKQLYLAQSSSAAVRIDSITCQGLPPTAKPWVVKSLDGKDTLVQEEVPLPCPPEAKISISQRLVNTMTVNQTLNTTLNFVANSAFVATQTTDLKAKNVEDLDVTVRAARGGAIGGPVALVLALSVWALVRAEQKFVTMVMDSEKKDKWLQNLRLNSLQYEFKTENKTEAVQKGRGEQTTTVAGGGAREIVKNPGTVNVGKLRDASKAPAKWWWDPLPGKAEFKRKKWLGALLLTGNGQASSKMVLFSLLALAALGAAAFVTAEVREAMKTNIPGLDTLLGFPAMLVGLLLIGVLGFMMVVVIFTNAESVLPGLMLTCGFALAGLAFYGFALLTYFTTGMEDATIMYVAAIVCGVLVLATIFVWVYARSRGPVNNKLKKNRKKPPGETAVNQNAGSSNAAQSPRV